MTKALTLVRYLFALCAVLAIVVLVDLHSLWATLSSADMVTLLWAFIAMIVAQILYTAKWKLLLAGRGITVGLWRLLAFNLVAVVWSTFLPGQIAGEAVKMVRLARAGAEGGALAASVVVDRITGLIGILILGLGGAWLSTEAPVGARNALMISIGAALVVAALGLVGLSLVITRRRKWNPHVAQGPRSFSARLKDKIWDIGEAVVSYRSSPGVVAISCVAGVIVQVSITVGVLLTAKALSVDLTFADAAWIFALTSIVQLVPVTVGGLGTREASFVGLMGIVGISAAQATAVSLTVFGFTLIFAIAGLAIELVPALRERLLTPEASVGSDT